MKSGMWLLLVALICCPATLIAQEARPAFATAECNAAAQAVGRDGPSPSGKRALFQLGSCGPARLGVAASALRQARAVRDTAYLLHLVSFVGNGPNTELVDAALEIAEDRDASVEARVSALVGIFALKRPMFEATYDDLAHALDESGRYVKRCSGAILPGRGTRSRLSAAGDAKVNAAMQRILAQPDLPREVRSAAMCVS